MTDQIYIEEYTQKSFVLKGDTKKYKETIKSLGGKWNSNLKDKKNGEKFGAWLFWSEKRKEIEKWVSSGCKEQKYSNQDIINRITRLENEINEIKKLINYQDRPLTRRKIYNNPEEYTGNDYEQNDDIPIRRRLLKC
jgi:hypothetical protein